MDVVTLRLTASTKRAYEDRAREAGVKPSEAMRTVLDEALYAPRNPERHHAEGEAVAPSSISTVQRELLANQQMILAALHPEEKRTHLQHAEILRRGFVGSYGEIFAGVEPEMPLRDCELVMDLLDAFRVISISAEKLGVDAPLDDDLHTFLRFRGLDSHIPEESEMLAYMRFLVKEQGRWEEIATELESGGGVGVGEHTSSYQELISATRERQKQNRNPHGLLDLTALTWIAICTRDAAYGTTSWTEVDSDPHTSLSDRLGDLGSQEHYRDTVLHQLQDLLAVTGSRWSTSQENSRTPRMIRELDEEAFKALVAAIIWDSPMPQKRLYRVVIQETTSADGSPPAGVVAEYDGFTSTDRAWAEVQRFLKRDSRWSNDTPTFRAARHHRAEGTTSNTAIDLRMIPDNQHAVPAVSAQVYEYE